MSPAADQLPEAFLARMQALLPVGRYTEVMTTFTQPCATGFRINTLRAEPGAVVAALEAAGLPFHPVPWHEAAFWVRPEDRAALLASEAYAAQHLYVQNLSSMVPPLVLAPEPGERVLDLTAAPGSKTLQMACRMEQQGELAAVELVRSRYYKLRANLEAQGATAVRTFNKDGAQVWRYRPEYFDRVLLDAPCSTEGRFYAAEPETYAYWSPRKIKEMARKQRRLLFSAVQCLRPGGTLVYSTCSFAPEENEAILDKTLKTFGDALHLEPLGLELDNMTPPLQAWQGKPFRHDLTSARRLLPTETMEGFFICKLRKTASTLR